MYQIRILDAATRDLAGLDPAVARRIVNRLRWFAENLDDIKPEALTAVFERGAGWLRRGRPERGRPIAV